jgi:O-antigen ligase
MNQTPNSLVSSRAANRTIASGVNLSRPVALVPNWQESGRGWNPPAPMPAQIPETAESGFQRLAFRAGLAMIFVRLAGLPDLLATLLHVDTYLLYLVGPPAIIGAIVTGGVARTFRHRAAWMWLGFLVCALVSLPFSSWVGGSVQGFRVYALTSFPLVFVLGGLSAKWPDVRATFVTFGVAGLFFIGVASLLAKKDAEGRLVMSNVSLSVGNSNDLASQLILVLPFILYLSLDRRVPAAIRYLLIVPVGLAFKMILGTASRGALVAIAVAFLFIMFRASVKQKIVTLVFAGALAACVPFMVNSNALDRLMTLFGDSNGSADLQEEANSSAAIRRYLLQKSLLFTMEKPLFGVGMGQFSNYVGKIAKTEGQIGAWNETHNTFTEVSSECGIPALLFFVAGICSALYSVHRIHSRAKKAGRTDIADAAFCYLLSMISYLVSIVFLANAYRFYLPAMIGLAIALTACAERELAAMAPAPQARRNPWASPVAPRPRLVRS